MKYDRYINIKCYHLARSTGSSTLSVIALGAKKFDVISGKSISQNRVQDETSAGL